MYRVFHLKMCTLKREKFRWNEKSLQFHILFCSRAPCNHTCCKYSVEILSFFYHWDFTCNQIWGFKEWKICHTFRCSELWFLWIFALFEGWKEPRTYQSLMSELMRLQPRSNRKRKRKISICKGNTTFTVYWYGFLTLEEKLASQGLSTTTLWKQ